MHTVHSNLQKRKGKKNFFSRNLLSEKHILQKDEKPRRKALPQCPLCTSHVMSTARLTHWLRETALCARTPFPGESEAGRRGYVLSVASLKQGSSASLTQVIWRQGSGAFHLRVSTWLSKFHRILSACGEHPLSFAKRSTLEVEQLSLTELSTRAKHSSNLKQTMTPSPETGRRV